LARRRVWLKEETASGDQLEVRLTPTEFRLLGLLVVHAGKVLTHKQLLTEVWGPSHAGDVQYLRVYAGQLRQKLEADPAQPLFLITEPGVGYRLSEPIK
jgi:two-component system KDP operon response regulator KdpE